MKFLIKVPSSEKNLEDFLRTALKGYSEHLESNQYSSQKIKFDSYQEQMQNPQGNNPGFNFFQGIEREGSFLNDFTGLNEPENEEHFDLDQELHNDSLFEQESHTKGSSHSGKNIETKRNSFQG